MDTRGLRGDHRGVSPVIGVVLMVALTVLLAATAATFFFGVQQGAMAEGSPTVSMSHDFGVERGSDVLEVRHTGGNTVEPATLRFVVAQATCAGGGDPNGRFTPAELDNADSRISAGSRFTLSKSTLCGASGGDLDLSRAEVTAVWIDTDGARSNTLWRWRGPSA